MKKLFIFIILFSLLTGCQSRDGESTENPIPETSAETYERWNPDNALGEAEDDIKNETVKIYMHGGFAAYPVGVEPEDYELIENVPRGEAGVGCIVYDMKLRKMQGKYATIYNKKIVEWIKSKD